MGKTSMALAVVVAVIALASCSSPQRPPAADRNPYVPGATGRTDVPGDPSTVAGDRKGTVEQKQGNP
jgi:hypothetical protein